MKQACEREVRGLHRFFEHWFRGEGRGDEAQLGRVIRALAPEFKLVTPAGHRTTKASVLEDVRRAHGHRSPSFSIDIQAFEVVACSGEVAVVGYEEWQHETSATTVRYSTAVFHHDATAPEGVVWVHLHETWAPEKAANTVRMIDPG